MPRKREIKADKKLIEQKMTRINQSQQGQSIASAHNEKDSSNNRSGATFAPQRAHGHNSVGHGLTNKTPSFSQTSHANHGTAQAQPAGMLGVEKDQSVTEESNLRGVQSVRGEIDSERPKD